MAPKVTLARALVTPFHFTSIVFITLLSLLLSVAIRSDITGILWLMPAFIVTSWIFKYAFAMLESVAHGESEAPVASYEILSVFEQRPLVLAVIVLGIAQIMWWMHGVLAFILVSILVALLPASIGILGATRKAMLSLNPLALLQTVRGMGWWYALLLLTIVSIIVWITWLARLGIWNAVLIWQIGMSVLLVFSLIGGVMYERRIEIGHEPRISPERMALADQAEHQRALKKVLDEMYTAVRLGDLVRGLRELQQWLTTVGDEFVATDCEHIYSTVSTWNDVEMQVAVTRVLLPTLVSTHHSHMAGLIVSKMVKAQPSFTFKAEAELLAVSHGIQREFPEQVRQLVSNFVNTFPVAVTPGITALLARLNSTAK